MKTITMMLGFVIAFVVSARGQGFGNLTFESAYNLPANPGDGTLVGVTNGLPDWTAHDGSIGLANIFYFTNYSGGSGTAVGLEGGSAALSGDLSVQLYQGGSISQTGLVPADAESLQFEASGPHNTPLPGGTGFYLTLGGQTLPYSILSEGSGYDVYGANIPSDLDDQLEALTLGCQISVGSGNVLLDNIEFSASSVPEPGEWCLIGVGAVLFGVFRWRKRSASSANFAN